MSPQNDPKYMTAPLLSPPYSLVQPNSNLTGTPPKLRDHSNKLTMPTVGSNKKGGADSALNKYQQAPVANSTAHHNFNMYRHSVGTAANLGFGGSERRNSSLGAATAGTDEGSVNGAPT